MKIRAKKDILQKGVGTVQNAVSSRAPLAILANMLLTTNKEKNAMAVTGTDLEIGMSTVVSVDVQEEGAGTIPAKRFGDIIRELPDGDVSITMKKNNLFVIEGKKCIFKIIGLPKEEFPPLPEFGEVPSITISQKAVKEMLQMTSFAISHDESRYVLNGLYITVNKDTLTFVATDGRRLALIKQTIDNPEEITKENIIPSKTIMELQKTLTEEGDMVISFGENQTQFKIGSTTILSRLIEGEFPNYKQVIPKEAQEKILIDRVDFLSAVKRAHLLTTQESLAVKIDISGQKMVVSKATPEIGELKEELQVEYSGESISIGFNPTFLLDMLKSVREDTISLEITSPDKPGVVRFGAYVYIVLPMQL